MQLPDQALRFGRQSFLVTERPLANVSVMYGNPAMEIAAKAIFFVIILLYALCGQHAVACDKKGVGLGHVDFARPDTVLTELNAHWYYNWGPTPVKYNGGVPFVTMVNGRSARLQSDLGIVASHPAVPILLGFNEPDHPEQANMSVDEAIALWPQLQRSAQRLGSPAPTSRGVNWLREFMAQAREKNLKVDFIAVHYYGPPDAQRFLAMVERIHQEFGLPIWVTEFGVLSNFKEANPEYYTSEEVLNFMHIVLPELERRSYVERYAWWGIGGSHPEAVKSSWFFNEDGSLTDVGRYYASIEANTSGALCGMP